MSRKYLKNLSYIPVEEELGKDDPRWKKWKKQIKKNGFVDYEVWNLDMTMVELLYERLQRFMEISLADAETTEVEWRGRRYSGVINSIHILGFKEIKSVFDILHRDRICANKIVREVVDGSVSKE